MNVNQWVVISIINKEHEQVKEYMTNYEVDLDIIQTECVHLAICNNDIRMLIILKNYGFHFNDRNIVKAVKSHTCTSSTIQWLLIHTDCDPAINKDLAIRTCVEIGSLSKLNILLKDPRVDPMCCRGHLLILACKLGHEEIVLRLLEDKRIDLNIYDKAIKMANRYSHDKIARIIEEFIK